KYIKPRENYNVNIVAIKKNVPTINSVGERTFKEFIEDVPLPDTIFEENDILLIVGADENIEKISQK
ncbi:MAG: TrkA C-terminal domain-containing protein, partial [Candidatus Omnitrophica bacterium]|nr:TrkA C-terminal domain-containing protein [Candidatus Omnitrophota bacterium]